MVFLNLIQKIMEFMNFKRGFGGYVVEFVGEFDLIISGFYYKIYNLAYKIYRNSKKVLSKFQKK